MSASKTNQSQNGAPQNGAPQNSAPQNSAPSTFLSHATGDCPPDLLARATAGTPPAFVFVRAIGDAVLQTAQQAYAANLIRPILVGEPDIIADDAKKLGWDLEGVEIVESAGEQGAIDAAIKLIQDGRASGLIKGQLHTDVFMGGIVKRDAGIRIGKRLVHVFAMLPPAGGRALMISDAAVNVAPDIETRSEAALLMADLVRKLGQERPKVAVLSATESILDAVPSSGEARMIANMAGARDDQADYAGPLSFDLAISPEAVAMKKLEADAPVLAVAGMADALVVPDIVSGNVLFKSLVWCAGGLAAGLVLGGGVPIVLTSRSDPPAARLASIALAVIAGKD